MRNGDTSRRVYKSTEYEDDIEDLKIEEFGSKKRELYYREIANSPSGSTEATSTPKYFRKDLVWTEMESSNGKTVTRLIKKARNF